MAKPTIKIALRYTLRKGKIPSVMVLSLLVTSAGVFGILSVLGLLNGMQDRAVENILEVSSYHMQITFPTEEPTGVYDFLSNHTDITTVIPYYQEETLVETASGEYTPVMVRALPEDIATRDVRFAQHVGLYPKALASGTALVGTSLAYQLGVGHGDVLTMLSLGGKGSLLRPAVYTPRVTGFLYASDSTMNSLYVIISKEDYLEVLPEETPLIYGIKTTNYRQVSKLKKELQQQYPQADIATWSTLNQDFVSALELEKNLIVLLLALMICFAGISVKHSVNRLLRGKRKELAMLKALGTGGKQIRTIVLAMGAILGTIGVLIGCLCAYLFLENTNALIATVLQGISWITTQLGVGYRAPYFFHMTYRLSATELLFTIAFTISMVLYAAWKGSRDMIQYSPMEVLKHE